MLRAAWCALAVIACALARPATAAPLDEPYLGAIGFGGATSAELSSIYTNPAAIGAAPGTRALVAVTAQAGERRAARSPIDPATGLPGGSRGLPAITGSAKRWPVSFGPGSMAAIALTLGNRVTIGGGILTPFSINERFGAAADGSEPARYHQVDTEFSSVALVPAISLRVTGGVRIGIAPTFMLSRARFIFDHDTGAPSGGAGATRACGGSPCGAEHPDAAARYTLDSDATLLDGALSFTLGAGIHVTRPRFTAAFSLVTRPLGTGGEVRIETSRNQIALPARLGAGATLCNNGLDPCLAGSVSLHLPSIATAGFDWHLSTRWTIGVQGRWLGLGIHDAVRLRVVGPAGGSLRAAGVPESLSLHRGLQDVYELRLHTLMQPWRLLGIALALRGETAAAPRDALSPAVWGGALFEPALGLRIHLGSRLALNVGYALAISPAVDSNGSIHDPQANLACEATGGDLTQDACNKRRLGLAGPTAAGRYRFHTHRFGLALSAGL